MFPNNFNNLQDSGDRVTRLIRLLDVYVSQYEYTVQRALACDSEITRLRSMIDVIANDIRGIGVPERHVVGLNVGAGPIPFSNVRNSHNPDSANPWSGHTFVYNHATPVHNVVDPSFNTINRRYPYGHVVYDSSLHDLSYNDLAPRNLQNFFDSVPIYPSFQQILNAVTVHPRFSDIQDPINEVCPISQKPFEPNEQVSRIKYCNHIFCRDELSQWFTSNIRCPVCRHDIRIVRSGNEEMYFSDESKEELPDLIEPDLSEQVWD